MQRHKSLIMISRIELISYFGIVLRGIYYNHLGFSYFKFSISKTAANSGRQKIGYHNGDACGMLLSFRQFKNRLIYIYYYYIRFRKARGFVFLCNLSVNYYQ